MEAALGTRLQLLVGENASDSLNALDYLKNEKQGRSSFISSEMMAASKDPSSSKDISSHPGFIAHLSKVVSASERHQPLVQKMLGKIVVVDSMMNALDLRKQSTDYDYVTMDGDVISADGIMTGGFSEDVESGVLQRKREIKELSDLKSEWGGKLALAQASLKKVDEQLANVINDFEGAQKRKLEQEVKVAELKSELQRAETEYQNITVARDRQNKEVIRLQDHLNQLVSQNETLTSELEGLRTRRFELESKIEVLTEDLTSTKLGYEGLQNLVRELQVQSATKEQEFVGLQRQVGMIFQSISELKSQSGRMSEESEMYVHQMTESQYKLEEKKIEFERAISSIESMKLELSAKKNEFEVQSQHLKEIETQLSESQRSKNIRQSSMNDAQLKLEQARMKEQYLIDQVREKYMLDLSICFETHLQTERDETEAEAQLKDLKEKISRIGEVNLSAIQEYDEVSKRYEFLSQQYNDLIEAKEQLRRVIERINKICSKKFKETFDLVNDRFKKVFPVLFGGGEAELILSEDPEKNEMGIEIIAKPPGKKMQNVSLMSGGEKALTAVSLVFSIFLVKPSPYCLLDEVDAPLDDANVYRFNELVKEMAKRSQIIVVTHNKHTMEVAKRLYGVTMQERGVSTMVSVSLEDIA
ncbi:MAG: chromosome segregation protein SMC, partial [Pseudobdellovibrionaceae bacterium]